MIARIWRGWSAPEQADDYQRHYETEIMANLRTVDGFRGAQLLRRADGDEVLFTAITWFTSLNAIRDFAGEDYEQAVMESRHHGPHPLGRARHPPRRRGQHPRVTARLDRLTPDGRGGRAAGLAAGEQAAAEEGALERVVAVHSAAAEARPPRRPRTGRRPAGRSAPSARESRSVWIPPSVLRVRTWSLTPISGPGAGSRRRCGRGGAAEPVAEERAGVADALHLGVLAERGWRPAGRGPRSGGARGPRRAGARRSARSSARPAPRWLSATTKSSPCCRERLDRPGAPLASRWRQHVHLAPR